jgi:Herelleviridae exonuclease
MDLKFQKLSIRNFKCIEAVDLDYSELPVGLHFVRGSNKVELEMGSNGAGKSSIQDALCWALFGKTVGGLRNPDIRPWGSDEKTTVTLTMEIDGKPYEILRRIPNNTLMVNGEETSQDHITSRVMSYRVFVNTLLLGQNRPLWFDLKPQDKMELFDDVLGLDRWERWSEAASTEVKKLTTEETFLLSELSACRASVADFKSLYLSSKSDHEAWEEGKTSRMDKMLVQVELYRISVKSSKASKDLLEAKVKKAKSDLKLARSRLEDEVKDLHSLDLASLKEKSIRKQAQEELNKLETQRLALRSTTRCPTCGQEVKSKDLVTHRDELSNRISELRILTDDAKSYSLAQDMMVASDLVEGTRKVINQLANELEEEVVPKLDKAVDLHSKLSNQLAEAEANIKLWSVEVSPHSGRLKELQIKLKDRRERVVGIKAELEVLGKKLDGSKFWVSGFKACRLYLLEEILDELKMVSNSILPELGLDGWELDYEIEKENKSGTIKRGLTVTITSPEHDVPVRFESYSGGEQQRLRLIGALALSEVLLSHAGIASDLEVLDEPTRSLSPEGIRDLCEALPSRAQRLGRKILYTDHGAMESSYFATTLTVERSRKGVSLKVE